MARDLQAYQEFQAPPGHRRCLLQDPAGLVLSRLHRHNSLGRQGWPGQVVLQAHRRHHGDHLQAAANPDRKVAFHHSKPHRLRYSDLGRLHQLVEGRANLGRAPRPQVRQLQLACHLEAQDLAPRHRHRWRSQGVPDHVRRRRLPQWHALRHRIDHNQEALEQAVLRSYQEEAHRRRHEEAQLLRQAVFTSRVLDLGRRLTEVLCRLRHRHRWMCRHRLRLLGAERQEGHRPAVDRRRHRHLEELHRHRRHQREEAGAGSDQARRL